MPHASTPGRPLSRPALVSVAATVTTAIVLAAVSAAGALSGASKSLGPAYTVWAVVVTFGTSLWIALLAQGIRVLRGRRDPWRRTPSWWVFAIGCYAALAVVASMMLGWITASTVDDGPGVPRWLIACLVALGWICAAPWIVTVWLAHEQAGRLTSSLRRLGLPSPADEFRSADVDGERVNDAVDRLREIWQAIERSTLALGLILSTAVLNTGALRTARLRAGVVSEQDFPAYYVLGYGAFFAAIAAVVVVPLVVSWRATALAVVQHAIPAPSSGIPTEGQLAATGRMEGRLGMDTHLLRSPLTALSVLAPLGTALLSALVPTGG